MCSLCSVCNIWASLLCLSVGVIWYYVQGFEYLMKNQLVDDTAEELAKFLHSNRQLDPQKKREFLSTRLSDFCLCKVT